MYIKLYQQRLHYKEGFVTLLSERAQLLVFSETIWISELCHQRSQIFYSHIYLIADEKEQYKLSAIWTSIGSLLLQVHLGIK
jgi:hypothetical protein